MLQENTFSLILRKLSQKHSRDIITVHLSLSIDQLEKILRLALQHQSLQRINFIGFFDNKQTAIFTNLYIAAIFKGHHDIRCQLQRFEQLSTRTAFNFTSGTFNFEANHTKHDVELHGYTAANVTRNRTNIERFKQNFRDLFMLAISKNDLITLKKAYYYGGASFNINELINGKLPIEEACANNTLASLECLLTTCNARFMTVNTRENTDSLDYIIKNNASDILYYVLQHRHLRITPFNTNAKDYNSRWDIFKRIIDADNTVLLLTIFKYYLNELNRKLESAEYKLLYAYAFSNNKHHICTLLKPHIDMSLALERKIITAIEKNNRPEFLSCIKAGVDLNFVINEVSLLMCICQHGRIQLLIDLLQDPYIKAKLRLYSYQDQDKPLYDKNYDLIYLSVYYNQRSIFLYSLKVFDIDLMQVSIQWLISALELASSSQSEEITPLLKDLLDYNTDILKTILILAYQKRYEDLRDVMYKNNNLDVLLNGQALIHALCSQNAHGILQELLSLDIEINSPNIDGLYPITLCIHNNCLESMSILLAQECLHVYKFNDTSAAGYKYNLDLIKMTLDRDQPEMLTILLKHTQATERLGTIDVAYLNSLLDYARANNKPIVMAKLHTYINTLHATHELFPAEQVALDNFLHEIQNVSQIDISAVSSLKALAAFYNISINLNQGTGQFYCLDASFHIDAEFERLERIINSLTETDVQYAFYKLCAFTPTGKKNSTYEIARYASLAEYKSFALDAFHRIRDGLPGYRGNYSRWHSDWSHPGTEVMIPNLGLTTKEIWALVIKAALDPHCFYEVEFTPEQLRVREKALVQALVEVTRTYNTNNESAYDTGGVSKPSCIHGAAMRALIKFSYMHPAIKMLTSPLPWALELVKEHTKAFFKESIDLELQKLIILSPSQLSDEQQLRLHNFYEEAKYHVSTVLQEQIGLLSSEHGGYLSGQQLAEAIDSVENVELFDLNDFEDPATIYATIEYTFVKDKIIYGANNAHFLLYKLPLSNDALLNAIILAALDQNVILPASINTASKIRSVVKYLMSKIVQSDVAINGILPTDLPKFEQPERLRSILKAKLRYTSDAEEEEEEESDLVITRHNKTLHTAKQSNFVDIIGNGTASTLLLEILSHLLQVSFCFYSFGGRQVYSISCRTLHNPLPINHKTLSVAVPCVKETNFMPDLSKPFALISIENQNKIDTFISNLSIQTLEMQIEHDNKVYPNFTIMIGRAVQYENTLLDQVKIKADIDSAYNAVLYAAKNVANAIANDIEGCSQLRDKVYNYMVNVRHLTFSDPILNNIATAEDFITTAEIEAMAAILQLNIHVLHAESSSKKYPTPDAIQTIYLYECKGFYNILVPKDTWNLEEQVFKRQKLSRS